VVVVEAVEELKVRLLILDGRVVVGGVRERAVALRKLLLWEMVAGVEQEPVEVHELQVVVAEAVEELEDLVPILEVEVLVEAVVHTRLETERSLPCN
jgi:hypothetical protein